MTLWLHDEHGGAELEIDGPAQPGDIFLVENHPIDGPIYELRVVGTCITATRGGLGVLTILWREGTVSNISADSALATSLIAVR